MVKIEEASIPALLALVEQIWIGQAFDEFRHGKDVIYFGTNSKRVEPARVLDLHSVYFKPNGRNEVTARGRFVGLSEQVAPSQRLKGTQDEKWRLFYGFSNLVLLNTPLPITSLHYHSTKNALRNDVASSCLIVAPAE